MSEPDLKHVQRVEILLEPSGGEVYAGAGHIGVEVGVKIGDEELMWYDADDGFIPHNEELERGNALIFDHVEDALEHAYSFIHERLKKAGWGFTREKRFRTKRFPGT